MYMKRSLILLSLLLLSPLSLLGQVTALAPSATDSNNSILDRYQDFTATIRSYHSGTITGSQVAIELAKPRLGRTPNPQRICMAIEIANIIGPIVESMQTPPGTWTPIPLPAFCTAPTPVPVPTPTPGNMLAPPAEAPTLLPSPDSVGNRGPPTSISNSELEAVSHAVLSGMFSNNANNAKAPFKTGAIPTPRIKLLRALATGHKPIGVTPAQFAVIPPQLSMWGNATYGDCVSAEEAFAVAAYSVQMGAPEQFISDSVLLSFASKNGLLNGANLDQVMQLRQTQGLVATSGTNSTNFYDGPYTAVNGADRAALTNAISIGPVKTGIAASQLQSSGAGNANGWVLTGARLDGNEDHCVALCGYGPMSYLAQQLGITLPGNVDGTKFGYLLFTWSTIGIIDEPSMLNMCGEWWIRNPTNVVAPMPTPTPTPTPNPSPSPTPTRRMANLLADVHLLVAKYQDGNEQEKTQVLSILAKAEKDMADAKQQLGIVK